MNPHESTCISSPRPRANRSIWIAIIALLLFITPITPQTADLVVQMGHRMQVATVAFSPDGRVLASGGLDFVIKLWDVKTGAELRTLQLPNMINPNALAFSPNGMLLASGGDDAKIRVWDIATGKVKRVFEAYTYSNNSMAFSPDGSFLAGVTDGRTVTVWEVDTGQPVQTLKHADYVRHVVFSPDGKTIAATEGEKGAAIWDFPAGNRLKSFAIPMDQTSAATKNVPKGGYLTGLAIKPNGAVIVANSLDTDVRLFDVESGRVVKTLSGHTGFVYFVAISADGKLAATVSDDKTMKVWELASDREPVLVRKELLSQFGQAAFSNDSHLVAAGDMDFTMEISLWSTVDGALTRKLKGEALALFSVAISPDGRSVAIAGQGNSINLIDTGDHQNSKVLSGHNDVVVAMTFDPTGSRLTTGTEDGLMKVWNVRTGKEIRTLPFKVDRLLSLTALEDGKTMAGGGFQNGMRFWSVSTGKELKRIKGTPEPVSAIAVSSDGELMATARPDGTIRILDVRGNREFGYITGHSIGTWSLAFSSDKKLLAGGGWDGTITVWSIPAGKPIVTFQGHSLNVSSIVFSKDGNLLLSGSWDGSAKLWNLRTGQEIGTMVVMKNGNWVFASAEGRFDTNKDLDKIEGLHWVLSDDPMTPRPLEIFMRQYYEPGLLPRLMKCTQEAEPDGTDTCDREFKQLPSIAEINRGQPRLLPPKTAGGGGVPK